MLTVIILWGMIGFMIYDQFTASEIEVPYLVFNIKCLLYSHWYFVFKIMG